MRLIPNSANALAASVVPLMPLSVPLIVDVLTLPSKMPAWLMDCRLPQHGALSWLTKQVPLAIHRKEESEGEPPPFRKLNASRTSPTV